MSVVSRAKTAKNFKILQSSKIIYNITQTLTHQRYLVLSNIFYVLQIIYLKIFKPMYIMVINTAPTQCKNGILIIFFSLPGKMLVIYWIKYICVCVFAKVFQIRQDFEIKLRSWNKFSTFTIGCIFQIFIYPCCSFFKQSWSIM